MDINCDLAVLASPRLEKCADFTDALRAGGFTLALARSGTAALAMARTRAPGLLIVDEGLPDYAPLELVKELLRLDARIAAAVVSPLPDGAFHEASEGLGVLSALASPPGEPEGQDLARKYLALVRPAKSA